MPPRVVKHRPFGGTDPARLILSMRARGASEAEIDLEIASREWASGFGRMWRYVGMWEARSR